jgi:hypothetical protein
MKEKTAVLGISPQMLVWAVHCCCALWRCTKHTEHLVLVIAMTIQLAPSLTIHNSWLHPDPALPVLPILQTQSLLSSTNDEVRLNLHCLYCPSYEPSPSLPIQMMKYA